MSMRTIAQKCGVTHGAPYKHLSKDRYSSGYGTLINVLLKDMIQS